MGRVETGEARKEGGEGFERKDNVVGMVLMTGKRRGSLEVECRRCKEDMGEVCIIGLGHVDVVVRNEQLNFKTVVRAP